VAMAIMAVPKRIISLAVRGIASFTSNTCLGTCDRKAQGRLN